MNKNTQSAVRREQYSAAGLKAGHISARAAGTTVRQESERIANWLKEHEPAQFSVWKPRKKTT
jgi:hypothetical protein